MKIKNGFVSNSSTTTFVCDVCGEADGGMDVSLSDVNMFRCQNSHEICEHHMVNREFTLEEKFKILMEHVSYEYRKENIKEITDMTEERINRDFKELILDFGGDDVRYEAPKELCPICSLQMLPDSDYLSYLVKKYGLNLKDIMAEVVEKYDSYLDFRTDVKK